MRTFLLVYWALLILYLTILKTVSTILFSMYLFDGMLRDMIKEKDYFQGVSEIGYFFSAWLKETIDYYNE